MPLCCRITQRHDFRMGAACLLGVTLAYGVACGVYQDAAYAGVGGCEPEASLGPSQGLVHQTAIGVILGPLLMDCITHRQW